MIKAGIYLESAFWFWDWPVSVSTARGCAQIRMHAFFWLSLIQLCTSDGQFQKSRLVWIYYLSVCKFVNGRHEDLHFWPWADTRSIDGPGKVQYTKVVREGVNKSWLDNLDHIFGIRGRGLFPQLKSCPGLRQPSQKKNVCYVSWYVRLIFCAPIGNPSILKMPENEFFAGVFGKFLSFLCLVWVFFLNYHF